MPNPTYPGGAFYVSPDSALKNGLAPPPEVEPILQYFVYAHLPERLQAVSKPFGDMAQSIVSNLPRNPERSVALRKLLEAKDAAVRAALTPAPLQP